MSTQTQEPNTSHNHAENEETNHDRKLDSQNNSARDLKNKALGEEHEQDQSNNSSHVAKTEKSQKEHKVPKENKEKKQKQHIAKESNEQGLGTSQVPEKKNNKEQKIAEEPKKESSLNDNNSEIKGQADSQKNKAKNSEGKQEKKQAHENLNVETQKKKKKEKNHVLETETSENNALSIDGGLGSATEVTEAKDETNSLKNKNSTEKQKGHKSKKSKTSLEAKNVKGSHDLKVEAKEQSSPALKEGQIRNPGKVSKSPKSKADLIEIPKRSKGGVEEQIRVHKMQEISRWKKQLEGRLEELNEQLVELAQGSDTASENASPNKKGSPDDEQDRQKSKEKSSEKYKKALELTKRMQQERKEMERRKQRRRELRQAIILKEVDLVQQGQLESPELTKASGSAKGSDAGRSPNVFSALEEKKQEIKAKRNFNKALGDEYIESFNQEEKFESPQIKTTKKNHSKKLTFKSPFIGQILEQEAGMKRIEYEKAEKKRFLREKQMAYGWEVRGSYFHRLHYQNPRYSSADEYGVSEAYNSGNVPKNVVINTPSKNFVPEKIERIQTKLPAIGKAHDNKDHSAKVYSKAVADRDELDDQMAIKKNMKQYRSEERYEEKVPRRNVEELREDLDLIDESRSKFERYEMFESKSSAEVNLNKKDFESQVKRKKSTPSLKSKDDFKYSERNPRGYAEKEVNEFPGQTKFNREITDLELELEKDQILLQEKISGVLNEIKKMELQVKKKEEKILKNIEKKVGSKVLP